MEEILELRKHGLDRARLVLADYRQHATIVSRKCVRSSAAADNVLIAADRQLDAFTAGVLQGLSEAGTEID